MRIDFNNNYQTKNSFTGIYKMPVSDVNLKEFKDFVVPAYNQMKKAEIYSFIGSNPIASTFGELTERIAKANNGSLEWLMQNAKIHGVNFPQLQNDTLFVISGKDVLDFYKYVKSREKETGNLFKRFITANKLKDELKEAIPNLPPHLRLLSVLSSLCKKENDIFNQFTAGKVVEVDNAKMLLSKMFRE